MLIYATGTIFCHLYERVEFKYSFLSLIYFISSLLSPLIGRVIDKFGYHLSFVFLAIILMITAHFLIAFTYLSAYACSTLIGFVFVLNSASMWPLVSIVVEGEDRIATAYGLIQSIQNLGLALSNLFVGSIIDNHGYFVLEIVFIFILLCKFCIFCGFFFFFLIYIYLCRHFNFSSYFILFKRSQRFES